MATSNDNTFTFSFHGITLRGFEIDGQPWFVARDVCNHLGINTAGGTGSALRKLAATEKQASDAGFPGMRGSRPIINNEAGLNRLVMRSDKPEAKAFRRWVNEDVLPAIRKDGSYVDGEEKVVTGEMTAWEASSPSRLRRTS